MLLIDAGHGTHRFLLLSCSQLPSQILLRSIQQADAQSVLAVLTRKLVYAAYSEVVRRGHTTGVAAVLANVFLLVMPIVVVFVIAHVQLRSEELPPQI